MVERPGEGDIRLEFGGVRGGNFVLTDIPQANEEDIDFVSW